MQASADFFADSFKAWPKERLWYFPCDDGEHIMPHLMKYMKPLSLYRVMLSSDVNHLDRYQR